MSHNQSDQRYLDLAGKWADGTITNEELEEYVRWLNSIDPDAELVIPPHIAGDRHEHKAKIYNEIRKRLLQQDNKSSRFHLPASWKAAAVLAGISLLGYFTYLSVSKSTLKAPLAETAVAVADIQPGMNGAVLQLANGKVIVLDTAADGNLDQSVMKRNQAVVFEATKVTGKPVQYNTLTTPRARQQQLVLPDGSRIWLNAESSIRFPDAFTGDTRQVEITGEAYLEVFHDKKKPFIVNLKQSSIAVLGTQFNVMAYPEETHIEATLLDGSIKFTTGRSELILAPGQQGKLLHQRGDQSAASTSLILERSPDLDIVLGWKNGYQSFKSADLPAILRQITRWYNVDVEYEGSIPHGLTFTGEIPREVTLKQLLSALESEDVHFDLDAPHRKLHVQFENLHKKS